MTATNALGLVLYLLCGFSALLYSARRWPTMFLPPDTDRLSACLAAFLVVDAWPLLVVLILGWHLGEALMRFLAWFVGNPHEEETQ